MGSKSKTDTLKSALAAMPGSVGEAMTIGRAAEPGILIFKVMGKMFAILNLKGTESVIFKCDPHLAESLRAQYMGVGHRSHLDRRFWISVDLAADVPMKEIKRLAGHSYDLVCATLTKK